MPPIDKAKARELFRKRVRAAMKRADEEFRGQYSEEIKGLLGLSKEEIDEITPDSTDITTYNDLITVVKEASRVNLEQAELIKRIRALGDIAVNIAKRVPKLAAILA